MLLDSHERLNFIFGVIGGILGYLLGEIDIFMKCFFTILVLDTATGMWKAWRLGQYQSKKFRDGLINKMGYMFALILAVQLDKIVGDSAALRTALLFFFTANESASIVENLGIIGIKVPQSLKNAIACLREDSENSEDQENNTNNDKK